MRIDLRNPRRERLFPVEVDGKAPTTIVRSPDDGTEVYLDWDRALDDEGHLRRCPACGCRELFVRKDFHQVTGLLIVVLAALIAMLLFGARRVMWGFIVLGAVATIDAVIYIFAGRCLVCYRCRSEFRDLPIRRDHPTWDLSTGEKYRSESGARRGEVR